MTNPIVIYTNLFTLKNKIISNNRYIDMYFVWLYNIVKYANLTPDDYCITFIDNATLEYLEKNNIYKLFKSLLPNFISIEYEQPVIIKDGMIKRYYISELLEKTAHIEYMNPLYIHLDIDVLVVKDIRLLFVSNTLDLDLSNKTTIYLKTEDKINSSNYYGELITEYEKKLLLDKNMEQMPGFTSGIFAWRNSKTVKTFFTNIISMIKSNTRELYTIDQPFFNAVVFNYLFHELGIFNFILFDTKKVGHNTIGSHTHPHMILINFCGIPGDDFFHWDKILLQLFLQNLTFS